MEISIVSVHNQTDAGKLLKQIGADTAGIRIMAPKAILHLVKINKLPNIAANILKQESLSLGADTAVSRDALTGKTRQTDCLVMGNLSQLNRLCDKLKRQPYGLSRVSHELECVLSNYQRRDFTVTAGDFKLNLNARTHIMGIINVTPDSFSGDGLYGEWQIANGKWRLENIIRQAEKMAADGADIIDVGGESSRPGARPVSVKEELQRVIPVIKILSKKIKVPISIDTYKSEVARQALANGACIVNDITALCGDVKMAKVVKKYKSAVVLMHMQGSPRNMQKNPRYTDVMNEIIEYLKRAINKALGAGVDFKKIIIDPGIGFGKTKEHNLEIIKRLNELRVLARPILIGTSRKSFIGKILGCPPEERLFGTIASVCLAVINGASIVRVHDVKEANQSLKVLDGIIRC